MADTEHVSVVKQGKGALRKWRLDNRSVTLNLSEANLQNLDLARFDLSGANLRKSNLSHSNLDGVQLARASLRSAVIEHASLVYAQAIGAKLEGASLRFTDLSRANFEKATLKGSLMVETDLSFTNLDGASLVEARIVHSHIRSTELQGTDFTRALCHATRFMGVDLSKAKGLDSVFHTGPSSIDLDTLFRSGGGIPAVFLEGCGVPKTCAGELLDLARGSQQYCTCFISYSECDQEFVDKLHGDLKERGVTTYRWDVDAKWGEDVWENINQAILAHDKVLIICSKDSLERPGLLREIVRALQKEEELRKEGRPERVLFPIRLDNYLLSQWDHPRKPDVVGATTADFRNWQKSEEYHTSLDRLINSLRIQESSEKRKSE